MNTLKIKPSHPSQGDHVLINACDFDPARHTLLDAPVATVEDDADHPGPSGGMRLVDIKAALVALDVPIPRNASKAVCQALLDANSAVARMDTA